MTSWQERMQQAHGGETGEPTRRLATPRQIDIQLRLNNGEKPRSREDKEKMYDQYIPSDYKNIMRLKAGCKPVIE
jgi:hypothetical protein